MDHKMEHSHRNVPRSRRCESLGPRGGTRHRMGVQTLDTPQRRLKILPADELDALYGRPTFTPDERRYDFTLSQPAQAALQEFRTVKAQGRGSFGSGAISQPNTSLCPGI
jgi:hypothetical protein